MHSFGDFWGFHRTVHIGYKSQGTQSQTDQKTSLLGSFHSVRTCYVYTCRRKDVSGLSQHWALHTTIPTCQARCTNWCNRNIAVRMITNHFLVRYEAHSTGVNSWLVLYSWSKGISRRKPTITLLNNHIVKLTSKYLFKPDVRFPSLCC